MTTLTAPMNTVSAERETDDDYTLRSLIETMIREGASEREIVRALNAAASRSGNSVRIASRERSPLRALQRLLRSAA